MLTWQISCTLNGVFSNKKKQVQNIRVRLKFSFLFYVFKTYSLKPSLKILQNLKSTLQTAHHTVHTEPASSPGPLPAPVHFILVYTLNTVHCTSYIYNTCCTLVTSHCKHLKLVLLALKIYMAKWSSMKILLSNRSGSQSVKIKLYFFFWFW